jgi:mRNA interferase RelE/StbE
MEVKFSKPFEKDLKFISEKQLALKVDEIINKVRSSDSISEIDNIKKIKGHKNCYRIRIGNYRLGIMIKDKTVWFARLMDRKDIYKHFP